jgi:pimeloyl-ACP methyl ester carboxylesterase
VQQWHRETGLSVLVFDYPGYGRSTGTPSEQGCYDAADAAFKNIVDEHQVTPTNVLLVGRSLGTGVAVELASRRLHRALVLVSPFTSIPDVAQAWCPLVPAALLMRNRFDSLSKIGECAGPIMIVHGSGDRRVPFSLGERLFQAVSERGRFLAVPGAGHGDDVLGGFFPALSQFLSD